MVPEIQVEGRRRVVIENLTPQVDCGRFPVKRVAGQEVVVEADAFVDGHDRIVCLLRYCKDGATSWQEKPMTALGNDHWRASFQVAELGHYRYTVCAWVDSFLSWHHEFERREDVADIASALRAGADLVEQAARRASGNERKQLSEKARRLAGAEPIEQRRALALEQDLHGLMRRYPDRRLQTEYSRELSVSVDRRRAGFSSWYEMFPRSTTSGSHERGDFKSCVERLPYVADMGFDVLYLPPIHPIGHTNRKGPDNSLVASETDPGSPWAIGSAKGGHKAVHPELGTLEDFRDFCRAAARLEIEVALDIAFQCSPDHPYVREHPEWFRHRPDGRIQYAENPPKKYEDIYPFDFETDDWEALWLELASVFEFWAGHGVRIFRVDNPHTKPFSFWEWLIERLRRQYPEVIFLAEAFTRPRIMHRLAKLGFTQSYTYFTWRNTKAEIVEYFTELSKHRSREYFRPNLWPNTPDILHEFLQLGGRPAFISRVTLAATLGSNYGIYGPAFELIEREPREHGTEEYKSSEKYEIRHWDLEKPNSLFHFIARLNRIRRENPALQSDWSLEFHSVDNEELVCYSKATDDLQNIVLVVVNLDPHYRQSGFVDLPLQAWNMDAGQVYEVYDLLSGARFMWHGSRNYVELSPEKSQAHVFRLRQRVMTEQDFDNFV